MHPGSRVVLARVRPRALDSRPSTSFSHAYAPDSEASPLDAGAFQADTRAFQPDSHANPPFLSHESIVRAHEFTALVREHAILASVRP
jgi:hypothetical protein